MADHVASSHHRITLCTALLGLERLQSGMLGLLVALRLLACPLVQHGCATDEVVCRGGRKLGEARCSGRHHRSRADIRAEGEIRFCLDNEQYHPRVLSQARPHGALAAVDYVGWDWRLYLFVAALNQVPKEDVSFDSFLENNSQLLDKGGVTISQPNCGNVCLRLISDAIDEQTPSRTLWMSLPAAPGRYQCWPIQCFFTCISQPLCNTELRASSHMSAGVSL
jgi:hypothetical protein